MSLIDRLRADQLTARQTSDKIATGLLTTLIGDAAKISADDFKRGIIAATDEKVIRTIKVFITGAEETKRALEAEFTRVMGHGSDDGKTRPLSEKGRVFMEAIVPKMRATDREIAILKGYLPAQLDEAALRAAIDEFKAANSDAQMGQIMTHLKTSYAGLYDGKLASEIARG